MSVSVAHLCRALRGQKKVLEAGVRAVGSSVRLGIEPRFS